ncbi:LysR family transcriptional regulator [Rhizobium halophytocola]|uniref:DNA-binding transcriptional LysR family regulator n=1 Tax=Rhizobium halophytocola TaxID=735519 RepID=A0ABS4E4U6_9HYPH|nr:LysR family transcriptional regulator [Rhizobium halophytocola]MBP1852975.1 DNA-binding transcriptional LysR family regulator [Rhizobium halophytocola]
MIDLRNIETFFWASALGSLRAASEKLGTTQPAISQRIASLEAALGVKLFERAARGVKLTAKGHELLVHAERMMQARNDIIQAARSTDSMSGRFHLGVAETIVQTWLPRLITEVYAAYPSLTIDIEVETSDNLQALLMSRRIGLAFLMGPVLEARVENRPLCSYPLAWVARADMDLGPQPVSLEQIAAQPIVTYGSGSAPYRQVRDMLRRAGISSPRMVGSASLSMIVRMVLDGIGTAVITPSFLTDELARGSLRVIEVRADPLQDLNFTASWVDGPDAHAARVIARIAEQVADEDREARQSDGQIKAKA